MHGVSFTLYHCRYFVHIELFVDRRENILKHTYKIKGGTRHYPGRLTHVAISVPMTVPDCGGMCAQCACFMLQEGGQSTLDNNVSHALSTLYTSSCSQHDADWLHNCTLPRCHGDSKAPCSVVSDSSLNVQHALWHFKSFIPCHVCVM